MSLAQTLTLLFWIQALLVAIGLTRRARLWTAGRPAPVSWLAIGAIPKRYFIDLHDVVARDPEIAFAHVATAAGASAAFGLIALNYGMALYWTELDWAISACAAIMLGGTYLMWQRRRKPLARLSRGAWSRLSFTLASLAAGLAMIPLAAAVNPGPAIALLALLLILAGALELLVGLYVGGPLKHIFSGLLHLAFHPRPERFRGARSAALQPMDLDQAPFGVGRPVEFRWNQLLGFDACVQCGKCEAACPAFAAGQPLNPKKLIQDLVVGFSGGNDAHYAGSPTPGFPVGTHHGSRYEAIVPALIEPDTLWSCTTCRACVEECPMLIEHVDAIVDLRRHQTLMLGAVSLQAAACLDNLRATDTLAGHPLSRRYDWAVDLGIRTLQPGESVEYLLIVGEGAYDTRYQGTLRALVRSLQAAEIDFAVAGALELDCGDTARRLGDEATFRDIAIRNVAMLARFRFQRILTADPHVLHCLRNEYPAFGGHFEVVHHSSLLAQLLLEKRLPLAASSLTTRITYHDPCYLGRYNGETEAPRHVLEGIGIEVSEMTRSRRRSRCCGGGGGAPLTDVPGAQRIPDLRIEDAREVGAAVIAVACPGCATMLQGVVGPRPEIIDIAELVGLALEPAAARRRGNVERAGQLQ